MSTLSALLAGLIFGLGLVLSGMANPAKVIGFLDLAGRWDPSLAFVMIGAIATALPGFAWARRRSRSLLNLSLALPVKRAIDRRLIAGAVIFGVGWGLAGICPGPAIVLAGMAIAKGVLFCAAMITGMIIYAFTSRPRA